MLFLKKVFFAFSILSLFGCGEVLHKNDQTGSFDLKKLEGRWEFQKNTTKIEEWTNVGENELKGRGFILTGNDTSFIEFLSIHNRDGALTYYAQISDNESSEIVPFKLNFQSDSKIEFVNNSLDFPKKIGYEILSESAMQSYIEGPRDGETVRILFDYSKKNL